MFFKSLSQGPILGLGSAAHPGFPPCGGTSPSFKWGTPASVSVWCDPLASVSKIKKKAQIEYQWGERWGQGDLKRRCVCWGRWSHGQTRRWAVPNGGPGCPRSLWNCHVAIASLLHWWSSWCAPPPIICIYIYIIMNMIWLYDKTKKVIEIGSLAKVYLEGGARVPARHGKKRFRWVYGCWVRSRRHHQCHHLSLSVSLKFVQLQDAHSTEH